MTHDEKIAYLKGLPKETISPTELSQVIGGNPYVYNVAAKQGMLTIPYIWHGRNLRIFKQPVIRLLISGEVTDVLDALDERATG